MCKYTHFYFFSPPMPIMLQPQRGKTSWAGRLKGDRGRFSAVGMQQMLMGWEAERGQKTVFCIRPNFYARFSQCSLSHALTGSSEQLQAGPRHEYAQNGGADGDEYHLVGGGMGMHCGPRSLQPEDYGMVHNVERIGDVAEPLADIAAPSSHRATSAKECNEREHQQNGHPLPMNFAAETRRNFFPLLCKTISSMLGGAAETGGNFFPLLCKTISSMLGGATETGGRMPFFSKKIIPIHI